MIGRKIPILIGLPGAGKSTVTAALAQRLNLKVFASDPFFRESRALPAGSIDPRRAIMERFVERCYSLFPKRAEAIRADSLAIDAEGFCVLRDGKRFRGHGEDAFRTYESEMLRWVHNAGLLRCAIPDLSASAPMRDEIQRLFMPEQGYLPLLLDVSPLALTRNVLRDYAWVRAARSAGKTITVRGEYERDFDAALAGAGSSCVDEEAVLVAVARGKLAKAAADRLPVYRSYARITVPVDDTTSVESICDEILPGLATVEQ